MIPWGVRRQITILSVVGLLLTAFFVAVYILFLRSTPTCSDGRQNQGELGVDCGGSCEKVCPVEIAEVITHFTRVFRVSPGVYDVAVLLENPNVGFGINSLPYEIKVYDAKNVLVGNQTGTTFVNEQERFVIFAPRIRTGNRVPVRAFISFGDFEWKRLVRGSGQSSAPKFSIEEERWSFDPNPRLTAILVNDSPTELFSIGVSAVVSDASGNALGASATVVDRLPGGASTPISFTWPEQFTGTPANTEILPRINAVTAR